MGSTRIAGHERIAGALRDLIASGELPVGAALPSEAKLCGTYGTSRGPVRHALATLRAEGLIETRQGRASRVASRALRLTAVEFMYFSRFARATGRKPSARTIQIVRGGADHAEATALGVDLGRPVIRLLRLRLLDEQPTMLERSTYREDIGELLFTIDIDGGSITERFAARGVDYATVEQEIDAVAANATDAEHLDTMLGAPLLRQRRTARDASGTAFEFADDRYRPDLVTFTFRTDNPQIALTAP